MSSKRLFAAALAVAALAGSAAVGAHAETDAATDSKAATSSTAAEADAKPAAGKKFSKSEIEAFLTKCSVEADEKGLTKARNKLAERKAFRRECMSKFGVEPKKN